MGVGASGLAAWIRKIDARVVVFLGLLVGILTWQTGIPGLVVYVLALLALLLGLDVFRTTDGRVLRTYFLFVVSWMAIKLVVDCLDGVGTGLTPAELTQGPVADAAILGLRLFVLLGLSLALALVASPYTLGAAVAWFARPVLRSRAWQAALALSLMIHFLPLTWRTLSQVRASIRRRCPHLPLHRRVVILGQATLRSLSQKTWAQAVAIASRRLDLPEAWTGQLEFRAADLAVMLVVGPAAVVLAFL